LGLCFPRAAATASPTAFERGALAKGEEPAPPGAGFLFGEMPGRPNFGAARAARRAALHQAAVLTAMAVVSNRQGAPTASVAVNKLDKGDTLQSTAERFRSEFAEWPARRPRRQNVPFTD
jgi:hypothetical protein